MSQEYAMKKKHSGKCSKSNSFLKFKVKLIIFRQFRYGNTDLMTIGF
jgi:hypothetical protein